MLYFDHKDMDYYLSWIMGRQIYDGSDPRECLETAARIRDGDAESWQRAWVELAQRVEQDAQIARGSGNLAAARAGYLRACSYYRAPLFILPPDMPAFREYWQQMRACFQAAAALSQPAIEPIQVLDRPDVPRQPARVRSLRDRARGEGVRCDSERSCGRSARSTHRACAAMHCCGAFSR